MSELMKHILCPFCFHTFSPQELFFRCIMPTCAGKSTDTIYAQARGEQPALMGRVLAPKKRRFARAIPLEVECESCQNTSRTRICPHCHFELSHDAGLLPQRIIAIIGGRAVGKTHYLASLITCLHEQLGKHFHFSIRMLGDYTQQRWERDFYTPLFIHKTVLQPNRPAEIDQDVKIPLLFRLTFTHHGRRHALNLSFFDTAGEDMSSLSSMSLYNRYITHADGIIFLLDPLQISGVREQISDISLPPIDMKVAPENIVSRLRDLFECEYHLRATRKVATPIAFTLTKMDTLFSLLEPGSEFHHPGMHAGSLDLDDAQSIHTEVSNYLNSWVGTNFRRLIENNFACYHYFGVSSLGAQPDATNHLSTVNPLRVEDPFLWILYQFGLIRGKKRR